MNMLFAIIAAVTMGSPTTYTEKVESVTISIDFQKNQGLSGDIERNEVTTAKISEKSIESVGRICSIPVSMTTADSARKTVVYDFKDKKGKRSKDSEVSETTDGKGYGVFVGATVFSNGKTLTAIVKDEYGIVDESYKFGGFTTSISPTVYLATSLRISTKTATGTLKYAHVNAEDTHVKRGVLTLDATYQTVELGGITRSQCVLRIVENDSTVIDKLIDDCDETAIDLEIERFGKGEYTPRSAWRGSASDIMTSTLTTISIQRNTITAK